MSLIRIYNGVKEGSKRMVNLTYISSVHLDKNKIKLYKSSQKQSIEGSFIFLKGGGTDVDEITFIKTEDAKMEFESIYTALEKYYNNYHAVKA